MLNVFCFKVNIRVGIEIRHARPMLRLGCFDVSALRVRLAFSIAHFSASPTFHPRQSDSSSPVGDPGFRR